jgi:hypothetical protein
MRNTHLQDAGAPTMLPSDDTIVSAWSSSPLGDPAADVNRPTVSHYDSLSTTAEISPLFDG